MIKIREQKREQEQKKREEDVQKEWLMKKQMETKKESDFKTELRELKNELNFNLNVGQQRTPLLGNAIQSPKPQQQINSLANLNVKPIAKYEDNCQYVSQPNQSVVSDVFFLFKFSFFSLVLMLFFLNKNYFRFNFFFKTRSRIMVSFDSQQWMLLFDILIYFSLSYRNIIYKKINFLN